MSRALLATIMLMAMWKERGVWEGGEEEEGGREGGEEEGEEE